uniref:Uncharacterized protein n=1 Tax=viral metagenome TaxID=1070528 RepID=A0A6M3J1I0_9ZZZZ
MYKGTVEVFLKGGTIHTYDITASSSAKLGAKAREHAAAIMLGGFRANSGKGDFEWFGVHWIDKVKVKTENGVPTSYATEPTGT